VNGCSGRFALSLNFATGAQNLFDFVFAQNFAREQGPCERVE
jgi:hypothetical protein